MNKKPIQSAISGPRSGNHRDLQPGIEQPTRSEQQHSKYPSAFLQAAYRDSCQQDCNKGQKQTINSSKLCKTIPSLQVPQLQTMDETRQTSEGRNPQAAYYGADTNSDRLMYDYGATGAQPGGPQGHGDGSRAQGSANSRQAQKYQPLNLKRGEGTTGGFQSGNQSQRISYLHSDSSFKSARVSAIGRNFESNRGDQYQTEKDKKIGMHVVSSSNASEASPQKQTAFQGYKRSVQIAPYNKIDISKSPDNSGPAQTYWQFTKEKTNNLSAAHAKASSSDMGFQQRQNQANPSIVAKGLNTGEIPMTVKTIAASGNSLSYQGGTQGPSNVYQRAGALGSPQNQFGPPKRLTTQKQSMMSSSSDNRQQTTQLQPYLAHLRGKKQVNNYQDQKKVLGQTIDDSEINSVLQGGGNDEALHSHRSNGPKTAMRPSLKPAGPTILQKGRNNQEFGEQPMGWNQPGNYASMGDRPSELRDEEQPYFMRAPFNAPNQQQNEIGQVTSQRTSVSPYRNLAATQYGLKQYTNSGLSPRGGRVVS